MWMNAPEIAFSKVLEAIYQAALSPADWPAALESASEWLGASQALLFTPEISLGNGGFFYPFGVSSEDMEIWSARYVGVDFWTLRTLERKLNFEGSVILDGDLSTREELLASSYYKNHLVRMKIGWLLAGVVLGQKAGELPFVAISFYRDIRQDVGFNSHARQKLKLLLPHFSRSLGVMLRLNNLHLQAAASAAAFDALKFGVVMLNAAGLIIQANFSAKRIFAERDGISCADASLSFEDGISRRKFEKAFTETLQDTQWSELSHFSNSIRVEKIRHAGAYLLQMSKLPNVSSFGSIGAGSRAVVFITDNERRNMPDPAFLIQEFKLSPAEARTAIALGEGNVDAAAEKLGIAENTVRSQVRQIYAKTGCSNRADLTKLLLGLNRV
jgi:DNA-binding CsgD family transcriptional regulator